MDCPKCRQPMENVTYENIEVDRCTSCHGIWFDMLEAEHLKALQGSESIDDGDPEVGKRLDSVTDIDCPICHVRTIRMVDARRPRIHFEACKVCYGIFFDAGEFTEFKRTTVLDFFRDLIGRSSP